jgi:hypothetical protein
MNTLQEPTTLNDKKSEKEAKTKRKVSPCIGCGSEYGILHDDSTYCPSCIGNMAKHHALTKLIIALVDDLVTEGVATKIEAWSAFDNAFMAR